MGNIEKTGFPVLHSLLVQKECDNTGEILFIFLFFYFFIFFAIFVFYISHSKLLKSIMGAIIITLI